MLAKDGIFREYDIRGVVGKDFDADLAHALGVVLAREVIAASGKNDGSALVGVGRDCRISGPALEDAMINGLLAGGVSVIRCGMGPTPQLYYSVVERNLDGGVQITASHNPGDQNGFKMMVGRGTLSGEAIQKLKHAISAIAEMPKTPSKGTSVIEFAAQEAYLAELIKRSQSAMGERKLRVVVDGGNGVGGMVGPELLRQLGCEVIEIFTEPDGRFPNHHPDPTVLENIVEMRKLVVEKQADVGIAWDGDADRIGIVDEKGNPIWGDMLLIIFGRALLKDVPGATIIGDVKCSELMFSDLRARGGNPVMSRTGHSLIKAKLKELHAQLAGEMSGHMFFVHRYYGFDDALHASARLVEILSKSQQPLSKMLADLPKVVSTPELRVDCPDPIKFKVVEKAQTSFGDYEVNTLDGVRVKFPKGWGLVRASNTQAALVMRFEAENDVALSEYRSIVETKIREITTALSR